MRAGRLPAGRRVVVRHHGRYGPAMRTTHGARLRRPRRLPRAKRQGGIPGGPRRAVTRGGRAQVSTTGLPIYLGVTPVGSHPAQAKGPNKVLPRLVLPASGKKHACSTLTSCFVIPGISAVMVKVLSFSSKAVSTKGSRIVLCCINPLVAGFAFPNSLMRGFPSGPTVSWYP